MERNLAIIGASYLQLPLIKKAKEMGFTTHVFAWAANDVGEKEADFFYPISIVEKEIILEKCRSIGVCGICSIASDLATLTVNYVADKLGLNGNSLVATEVSTNKYSMRKTFEKHGDPSPKSILVDEDTDLETLDIKYPVIIKPTDRSGSRGICKVNSKDNLMQAVLAASAESFEKKVLIEEFADGQEYSVEYISYKGKHYFLALTQKFTTGAPSFIETGHMEPATIDNDTLEKVKSVIEHALNSLGIENSASHSEIKIASDGTIRIIEIGGRMGGDCIGSHLVQYSTGIDFVRCVIQVACDIEPDLKPVSAPMGVKSIFIFTQEDVDNMYRIRAEQPEKFLELIFLNLELIDRATDSSNRAGCYIVKA